MILKVPVGKKIIINDEVANFTDRYRYDFHWEMEETSYIMTKNGLEEYDLDDVIDEEISNAADEEMDDEF